MREKTRNEEVIMTDTTYMRLALELAKKGCGWVNPNPMVGAVIVKDGQIIGQGYHERYGQLHAERNALKHCSISPEGATIYVTLEPCCHYGKTPPCTEAIIQSGIRRVVIGSSDPNPLVAGKGIEQLCSHGIEVTTGVLKEQCDQLNQVFFHYIQTKTPYVVMKYAMTMDGKIATRTGKSKWITGAKAREQVHFDRHRYMGIMVGIHTVLTDDPLLTCRLPNTKHPIRIVCDTKLRTPLSSQLVQTAKEIPTIVATCCTDEEKQKPLLDSGCQIIVTPQHNNQVDLHYLMEQLGKQNIDSILLEGGGTLNWSALNQGIVKKVQAYIAPKLFGGIGTSPVTGIGIDDPSDCIQLSPPEIKMLGNDILLESEVVSCSQESLKK